MEVRGKISNVIKRRALKFSVESFKKALHNKDTLAINKLIAKLHLADIVEIFEKLSIEELIVFLKITKTENAAALLQELDFSLQEKIIAGLTPKEAAVIVQEMESDDAADLLGELPEEVSAAIIQNMDRDEAADVSELMSFAEDTAGGIMSKEFVAIPQNLTVAQAISHIRKKVAETELRFSDVYVVDEEGRLVGIVSTDQLVINSPKTKIKKIREDKVLAVAVDADQEKAAEMIAKYDLYSLPVIDQYQRMVGLITVDDVIDIIEEETSEDILKQAATLATEEAALLKGSVFRSAWFRLPWLLITLLGGFMTSYIIRSYSMPLSQMLIPVSIIMSFQPMLLGMGGNVGSQSSTIMVRGIAIGEVEDRYIFKHLLREITVGLLIGLVLGLIVTVFSFFFHTEHNIGFIIGIAMCTNTLMAVSLGTIFPLFFRKVGIDPAVASGPMITTIIDILGLIIYFSLSILLIKLFFPL